MNMLTMQDVDTLPRSTLVGIRGSLVRQGKLPRQDSRLSEIITVPSRVRVPQIKSSYTDEHLRMKPVMDQVRKHAPYYAPISAGFEVYCTRKSRPAKGRRQYIDNGRGDPATALVATVRWGWNHNLEKISHLEVTLSRQEDLRWASRKIGEIFRTAGQRLPSLEVQIKP